MNAIQELVITAPVFLFALTAHEYAHGYVARQLGDPTAESLGRLTMNPIKHIDPLGALSFILFKIGWAKPVPVDARYFRNPRQGLLLVALAGPAANLTLALLCVLSARFLAPLGSILPVQLAWPLFQILGAGIWINLMLAVFNLLPIPPLDGSRVAAGLLPLDLSRAYVRLEPFGFVILLVLFYTGLLPRIMAPLMAIAQKLVLL